MSAADAVADSIEDMRKLQDRAQRQRATAADAVAQVRASNEERTAKALSEAKRAKSGTKPALTTPALPKPALPKPALPGIEPAAHRFGYEEEDAAEPAIRRTAPPTTPVRRRPGGDDEDDFSEQSWLR